jgi:hypothetical protein
VCAALAPGASGRRWVSGGFSELSISFPLCSRSELRAVRIPELDA